jgi:hypothetical protein
MGDAVYLSEKMNIPRRVSPRMINTAFSSFLPDVTLICFPVKIAGKSIANNEEKKKKKQQRKTPKMKN